MKKEDVFVFEHARQALVAHLAILAASVFVGLTCALLVGFILVPFLALLWLLLFITSIIAAIKSMDGELYRYPLIQGLVQKIQ